PSGAPRPRIRDPAKAVRRLAYSPDGELLASTSKQGAVQFWHIPRGDFAGQFILMSEDERGFYSAAPITPAFSPDGRYLACIHSNGSTRIEAGEMASGERVRVITQNKRQTRVPVVLLNGRTLLLGDHWKPPQLFDLMTSKELPRPMDVGPVHAI